MQSRLPLSEVVLYRRLEDGHIDTIDFRSLFAQILTETNATAKIRVVTPTAENNLGNDILLSFNMLTPHTPRNREIEVITVRLKEAFRDRWYKYLHIILDVAPLEIVDHSSHLHLKPIPLKFDSKHEIACVKVEDVDEKTTLVIPQASQAGAFYHHNRTNLLWTNTLSKHSNRVEPFTLILSNFYQEPKLQTLLLQFTSKKLVLKNKLAELNVAKDFEHARNERLIRLRSESLAIMYSKPLDLQSTPSSAHATQIDVQEYSSNQIKPISRDGFFGVETDAIDPERRRRSIQTIKNNIRGAATRKRRAGINAITHSPPQFF